MKKLLSLFFLFGFSSLMLGQTLSGTYLTSYKYFIIENTSSLVTKNLIRTELSQLGYNVISLEENFPEDLIRDSSLAIYINSYEDCGSKLCSATIELRKAGNEIVWKSDNYTGESIQSAIRRALKPFSSYKYFYSPKKEIITDKINLKSEESIKSWLDQNATDPIEGIWIFSSENGGNYFRGAIIKNGDEFFESILECYGSMSEECSKVGGRGVKISIINKMASEGIYVFKQGNSSSTAILKGSTMDVYYPNNKALAIKEYPIDNYRASNQNDVKKSEWKSNGSGLILSESGYIVTNYHVIDDAKKIEVEFLLDEEIQKFNAEIIQVDKVNDLAIIKIVDINFDGLDHINYNFQTRSTDVGTKIYAFGYPMALSLMGKEIKVTDGIISSKSGFDGDITTYQITAPIQGGNSGGPLFDDKGNFLGINSSKLKNDIADNVGYTIKSNYVLNLIDVLPKKINLPASNLLESMPLTEQIKEITKYVVLVKVR